MCAQEKSLAETDGRCLKAYVSQQRLCAYSDGASHPTPTPTHPFCSSSFRSVPFRSICLSSLVGGVGGGVVLLLRLLLRRLVPSVHVPIASGMRDTSARGFIPPIRHPLLPTPPLDR